MLAALDIIFWILYKISSDSLWGNSVSKVVRSIFYLFFSFSWLQCLYIANSACIILLLHCTLLNREHSRLEFQLVCFVFFFLICIKVGCKHLHFAINMKTKNKSILMPILWFDSNFRKEKSDFFHFKWTLLYKLGNMAYKQIIVSTVFPWICCGYLSTSNVLSSSINNVTQISHFLYTPLVTPFMY